MAYINLLGQVRLGVRPGIVLPTFTPLLDLYPGATASYSFRKLRSSYTGAAIRVRRSTDGLETDISFTQQGDLDETSLLSFVGNINVVSYSSQYDNASWTKSGISITPNGATAPDGTLTADLFAETTQVIVHNIQKSGSISLPTDTSWNSSIYIKKGDGNTVTNNNIIIARDFSNLGGGYWGGDKAIFNLDTGSVITRDVTTLGLEGATMSSVGNGWFRLQMWGRTTADYNNSIPVLVNRAYYDANGNLANPTQAYIAGQTGAQYYIWGSQFTYKTGDVTGKIVQDYTDVGNGYGGSAWVTKWYDQTGNGKHLSQLTAVNQSPLVVGRVINKIGGKPCLSVRKTDIYVHQMSYTGTMSSAGEVTLFSVAKFDVISATRAALRIGPSNYATSGSLHILAASTNVGTASFVQNQSNSYVFGAPNTANTNRNLFYSLANGGSSVVGHNGANTGSNFSGSITSLGNLNGLYINTPFGSMGVDYYYSGDIQEIVLYNSNMSVNRFNIDNSINSYYSIYTSTVDTDAQAFITAAGITNTTQQTAINKLVSNLKNIGVWTKIKAIYPFVGGNATSHKFNLKDPRDVDVAYRLVFSGGWTHSSTGALPNGTTGYADTKFLPSSLSSAYIGIYSRTNSYTGGDQIDMGAATPSSGQIFMTAWTKGSAFSPYTNNALARYSASGMLMASSTVTESKGWYSLNRISGQIAFDKNDVSLNNQFTGSSVLPGISIYLSALNNNGSTWWFSNRELAMTVIADSITNVDKTSLYNVIQTFQTDLGRQV